MHKSAVIKLTAYYTLLLALLALIFSSTLYFVNRNEIATGLKSQVNQFDKDGDNDKDSLKIYDQVLSERSKNFAVKVFYYDLGFIVISIGFASFLARRTLKPIEEASMDQIKFVADASHQLRTPLANIQLATEVTLDNLKKHKIKPAYYSDFRKNLTDIKNLNQLIDKLLNIARSQSGKYLLHKERVDLKKIVLKAANSHKLIAAQSNITILVEGSRLTANIDQPAVEQAINILIDNAIKYSPLGSKVIISLIGDRTNVYIKVKDYGLGIKHSDSKKIFKPFYRSSELKNSNVHGFGLGLPLAKQIVEAHGGNITLSSHLGQGSTFVISLPTGKKVSSLLH